MKVAVYVAAQGGEWQARISLNLAVDELWWAGEAEGLGRWGMVDWENEAAERKGQRVDWESQTAERKGQQAERKSQSGDRVVLLSRSLPLGWAVKLAAACRFTDQMQHWDEAAWRKYASAHLKTEIRAEQAAGGERGVGWPFEEAAVYRLPEDRGWSGRGGESGWRMEWGAKGGGK
ncbi:hypothetical protein [Paenibacillus rhizoplanae]|uniref:hypothetical protein n=1 Tax=Paenibacillus rhizoplanae TaxID=1917181 RepID=UPI003612B770